MKLKLKAAGLHFLLSLIVAALAALLVFFVWYPNPLHKAVSVSDIFWMMLGIDVCLGPLLTMVVYQPNKKSLKTDLGVIALVQIVALLYGMHTVFIGKPAYIVFAKDTFDLVRVHEIHVESAAKTPHVKGVFEGVPWFNPKWTAAEQPKDKKRAQEILFQALSGGGDWPQMPETYVSLDSQRDNIKKVLKPLERLLEVNKDSTEYTQTKIATLQTKYAGQSLAWVPLRSPGGQSMVVIVNSENAQVLEIVDLKPW